MANANKPAGLVPVKHLLGASMVGQGNIYYIASTDVNAFAIGDPVASSGSADSNGVPGITLATAGSGNAIRGVIVGLGRYENLLANPSNLDSIVVPATKTSAYYALVVDDPYVVFSVQEVSGGTQLTADEVGLNANLTAGANNGYVSGWQLNNAGEGTGATLQVRLLGLQRVLDNTFGAYAKWLVTINNHELKAGVAGV